MKKRNTYLFLTFALGVLLIHTSYSGIGIAQDDKSVELSVAEKPRQIIRKESIDPNDPKSVIYRGSSGVQRSTGDPKKSGFASEAYRIASGWHPEALDVSGFPKDKFGLINWVAIFKEGIINPRGSLEPDFVDMDPMDLNILFEMKGGFVDNVIFPHFPHTFWLDCTNCHDEIFIPMAGANPVKMPEIAKGQWCGRCHGRVAFPIADCTRCHAYPKGDPIEETASRRTPPE